MSKEDTESICGYAAEFLSALSRALKTSILYPPNSSVPKEFRRSCWERLAYALDQKEILDLQIARERIQLDGETVFESDGRETDLSGILHRDGVRSLRFHKGLESDEFFLFFEILRTVHVDSEDFEDIVNLLWECDFDFIEYDAVDEFAVTSLELPGLTRTRSLSDAEIGDLIRSERASAQNTSEQQRLVKATESENMAKQGLIPSSRFVADLRYFSEQEKREIQKKLESDQETSVQLTAIDLLFEIAVSERTDGEFTRTCNTMDNMFNRLLESEKFPQMVYMIEKYRDTSQMLSKDARLRAERLRQSYSRCGDRIRVTKLTEILNRSEAEDFDGVRSYLEQLDWSALAQLLWMLGELVHFHARRMLCDLLKDKGRQRPDIIAGAVYDHRWYVVRNATNILGQIGTDKCVPGLKKASAHEDERVRWEAVLALCNINSRASNDTLIRLLSDESDRIRRAVAHHIGQYRVASAQKLLLSIVNDKRFKYSEPAEQREYLNALALIGDREAFHCLKKMAGRRIFIKSEVAQRVRDLAFQALILRDDDKVDTLLEKWASGSRRKIRAMAQSALARRTRSRSGKAEMVP